MHNLSRWTHSLSVVALVTLAVPAWAQTESGSLQVTATPVTDSCGQVGVEYTDEAGLTLEEKIRRMDQALTRSLNKFDECQDEDEKRPEEQAETDPETRTDQAAAESEGGEAESESAAQESEVEASEAEESESQASSQAGGTTSTAPGDISGDQPRPAPQQQATTTPPQALPNFTPPPASSASGGSSAAASGVQGDGGAEHLPAGPSSIASGDLAGNEPEPEPAQQASVGGTGVEGDEAPEPRGGGTEDGVAARSGGQVLNNGKLPDDIPPADNDSILEAQIRQAAINEPDPELKKKLWNEYRKYKGLPPVK